MLISGMTWSLGVLVSGQSAGVMTLINLIERYTESPLSDCGLKCQVKCSCLGSCSYFSSQNSPFSEWCLHITVDSDRATMGLVKG